MKLVNEVVSAERSEELKKLIEKAKARYDALSPEEKEAYDKAQQESWVRGQMALGND